MRRTIFFAALALGAATARADIHDEFHACVHERLQQLKKAGFRATSAADQFCIGYGYWMARSSLPHNPAESARWIAQAAAQGHPGAETVLGYYYEQGHGVAKNYALAVQWLQKAAARNYPDAMFHLGRLSSTGKGLPRNPAVAREWFQKAAKAGSADGVVALRKERELPLEQPARAAFERAYRAYQAKDYPTAAQNYRIAADAGNARAQEALGTMMRLGLGVPANPAGAVALYRKAAEAGLARAAAQVGFAYEQGEGVRMDWVQAAKWCTASARQFDKLGLYCLARMYQFGIGVAQDRARAIRIFDRAEDQGDGQSKFFASWLRVPYHCVGYRDEYERNHYLGVCEDPKGLLFAGQDQRFAWLAQKVREIEAQAAAASRSMNEYGAASCSAAGGNWGGGGCRGDGGQYFQPGQQDRFGRPLW